MEKDLYILDLPRILILAGEVFMVSLWGIMSFWGMIFIFRGLLELNALFLIDRAYGLVFAFIGLFFLKQTFRHAKRVRTEGLRDIVQTFLDKRFIEIVATAVFMLMTAVIVINNIQFFGTTLLLLPMIAGTTFGVGFGFFLTHTFGISSAPVIIIVSTWIMELFWMYYFSTLVVKVINLFQLRSEID